jgi:hypothetical protein
MSLLAFSGSVPPTLIELPSKVASAPEVLKLGERRREIGRPSGGSHPRIDADIAADILLAESRFELILDVLLGLLVWDDAGVSDLAGGIGQ